MVAHTCNPAYMGGWDKIWQDQGQPGNTDIISNNKAATKWNSFNSIYCLVHPKPATDKEAHVIITWHAQGLKREVLQVARLTAETHGSQTFPPWEEQQLHDWASVFKDLRYTATPTFTWVHKTFDLIMMGSLYCKTKECLKSLFDPTLNFFILTNFQTILEMKVQP